jgi:DHA1 family multidrug resistance protein-like MFS transporter
VLFERLAIRDWRAVTALFMTSTLLESLAMGHLSAFTPLFLGDALHVPRHEIGPWTGLLTAATFAVGFPLAPLWGSLAERYTHKLLIVRSQYIQAVAYIVCGLAPDLGWFLVARLLLGLALGNIALVIATQSLLTPDRRIGSAIAVVQAANPIAVSFGPPLGALALPWLGLRGLFIADALGCLLAGVLITLMMPEPAPRNFQRSVAANVRKSVGIVWRRPVLRWNFAIWYLTRGATNVVDSYLPVRIGELTADPAPAIGTVMGVYGALTTLGTWWAGRRSGAGADAVARDGLRVGTLDTGGVDQHCSLHATGPGSEPRRASARVEPHPRAAQPGPVHPATRGRRRG